MVNVVHALLNAVIEQNKAGRDTGKVVDARCGRCSEGQQRWALRRDGYRNGRIASRRHRMRANRVKEKEQLFVKGHVGKRLVVFARRARDDTRPRLSRVRGLDRGYK